MQSRIPSCFQQIFRIQFGKLLSCIFCKFSCLEDKKRPEWPIYRRETVIHIRIRHTAIHIRVIARKTGHTGLFFFRHLPNLFGGIKVKIRKISMVSFCEPWRPALIQRGGDDSELQVCEDFYVIICKLGVTQISVLISESKWMVFS